MRTDRSGDPAWVRDGIRSGRIAFKNHWNLILAPRVPYAMRRVRRSDLKQ
jgi:hypothetical protein